MFNFVEKMKFFPEKIEAAIQGDYKHSLSTVLMYINIGICNQNCFFCDSKYYQYERKQKTFTKAKLDDFVEDFRRLGVDSVIIVGEGGEPILDPNLVYFSNKLLELGINLGIYTNGSICDDEVLITTLSKYEFVRVSLDAGNGVTYSKIHGAHDFDNVMSFMRKIKSRGLKRIGVSFIVMEQNVKEMYECAVRCQSMGADYIEYKPLLEENYQIRYAKNKKLLPKINEQLEKIKELKINVVYNNHFKLLIEENIREDFTKSKCHDCMTCALRVVINPFGYYRCSPFKLTNLGYIADSQSNSLRDIWGSNFHKAIIQEKCDKKCTYYKQNQALLAMKADVRYRKSVLEDEIEENVQQTFL